MVFFTRRLRALSPAALSARAQSIFRGMRARGDITILLIACALMVIPAIGLNGLLSVPKSGTYWPISLSQLIVVGAASILFGYALARSRYNELVALLLSGVYGLATVTFMEWLVAPGDPIGRIFAIVTRLRDSVAQASMGNVIQDPFLLILFLCTLFWFLGHNTAWHIFRIDRVWRAVIPPGIVLLINGLYNFGPINLDLYLIIYAFLALILVVRSNLDTREYEWYFNHVGYDRRLRTWFYRSGAIAGIAVLLVAWTLPTGSPEQNQQRFQQFINGDVLKQINKLWERLFTPLDSTGTATADYYGRDQLQLGGAIQLGDQEVLRVSVPLGPRYYWESRVFDTYANGTWDSNHPETLKSESGGLAVTLEAADLSTRQDVTQTFTLSGGPTRLIYAAPQFRSVDRSAEAEVHVIDPQTGSLNVSAVRPLAVIQQGEGYSVVSSLSTATADQLRAAPTAYAGWLAPDLALDPAAAPRARKLAAQIVADAKAVTPYDKAKSIESWLRTNIAYDEYMPTPPTNQDVIDWALFTVKRAYCTYYASAMVVMLRSQGIPARMVAGFAQGIWDAATGEYVVRERDAHTWVEVYFPGTGWIDFEPTAAQSELNRQDQQAPHATSTATPSPTPTPTPLPPTVTPIIKPQSNNQQQTVAVPTNTPFPTATPTITPTLIPAAPPARPTALSGLLALGVFVSVLIAVISFAGVGALWWIEYRGLDGLSPAARAYARLSIYGRWLRIPQSAGATPLERGRRIARGVPRQSANIVSITDLYIHERYAPIGKPNPRSEDRARLAWHSARWGMIQRKIAGWFRRA